MRKIMPFIKTPANIAYFLCGAVVIAIVLYLLLWTMWAIGDVWFRGMGLIIKAVTG